MQDKVASFSSTYALLNSDKKFAATIYENDDLANDKILQFDSVLCNFFINNQVKDLVSNFSRVHVMFYVDSQTAPDYLYPQVIPQDQLVFLDNTVMTASSELVKSFNLVVNAADCVEKDFNNSYPYFESVRIPVGKALYISGVFEYDLSYPDYEPIDIGTTFEVNLKYEVKTWID